MNDQKLVTALKPADCTHPKFGAIRLVAGERYLLDQSEIDRLIADEAVKLVEPDHSETE